MFRFDQIRIISIGSTGSGLSSTGNTILKKDHFLIKKSARSVTRANQKGSTTYETCFLDKTQPTATERVDVLVYDNPGFHCTELSRKSVVDIVKQTIQQTSPGPNAILYNIKIGRLPYDEIKSFAMFLEIFGKRALPYVLAVFTNEDNLESETLEQYIHTMPNEFQVFCESCGLGVIAVNNRLNGTDRHQQGLQVVQKIFDSVRLMRQPNLPIECMSLTCFQKLKRFLQMPPNKIVLLPIFCVVGYIIMFYV